MYRTSQTIFFATLFLTLASLSVAAVIQAGASNNQSPRKQAFWECYQRDYEKHVSEFMKEVKTDCGTCEAQRDEAVHDCKRYLTKEEIKCEDSAEYGAEIGDPFRCEGK